MCFEIVVAILILTFLNIFWSTSEVVHSELPQELKHDLWKVKWNSLRFVLELRGQDKHLRL